MYRKNAWEKYDEVQLNDVMSFNEGYKDYLSASKTERLAVKNAIILAEAKGFKSIDTYETLKPGDKVYFVNKKKNFVCYVIGLNPFSSANITAFFTANLSVFEADK